MTILDTIKFLRRRWCPELFEATTRGLAWCASHHHHQHHHHSPCKAYCARRRWVCFDSHPIEMPHGLWGCVLCSSIRCLYVELEDEIKSSSVLNVNILWHFQGHSWVPLFGIRRAPVGGNLGVGRMCRLESIGLNTRVFNKSNVRRVDNAPVEYKRRMGAVRLARGNVDFLVMMTYMWPEPFCVTDRRHWW